MSLFDSFIGPRWQHKDPQVRIRAIAAIDDPQLLMELASQDPDPGVQGAALARIHQPAELDALIEILPGELKEQARRQRLATLLDNPQSATALQQQNLGRQELILVMQLTDNAEILGAAVEQIADENAWLELATSHPLAQVRLISAQHIQDMNRLEDLMNRSRGHDKGVYRHCKSRVDEHRAQLEEKTRKEARVEELVRKAAALESAADAPDYESRYLVLKRQWAAVESSAKDHQKAAFGASMAACEKRLLQQEQARAADEQEMARQQAALDDSSGVLRELDQLAETYDALTDSSTLAHLSSTLEGLSLRWRAANEIKAAEKEQEKQFKQCIGQWQQRVACVQALLDNEDQIQRFHQDLSRSDSLDYQAVQKLIARCNRLCSSLQWPASASLSRPEPLASLEQAREQLSGQLEQLERKQQKFAERIRALLETEKNYLQQEQTRQASRAHSKIRRLLKSLSPAMRKTFEKQLGPMASRLHEAHDWQDFAVEPKKVALCASMKALIGSEEDVEVLALKIQTLQNEWKQLGGLPHAREQELWLEFKAAADEAWKPCKAAFEAAARHQQENLQKRMQLVDQLAGYEQKMNWPDSADGSGENGAQPDWSLVQKTLDTARSAFRQIKPVTAKGERESQKAFRAVCDRIYGHIKQEYGRNIDRKKNLVEKAERLAGEEDLKQAIEAAKQLQREWKETGITPVKVDRELWKSFRAACDAVFARLDEQRSKDKAALSEQVARAEALRDEASKLLDTADDEAILQASRGLSELAGKFRALELPGSVRHRLQKEFSDIESRARKLAQGLRARQQQAVWEGLFESLKACASASESEREANEWPAEDRELPRGIDTRLLSEFWKQGPDSTAEDAQRDACISLEILGEVETPEADKEARMKLQMQRLVEGLGARHENQEQALQDCINTFIGLRPTGLWVERFCATLRTIRAADASPEK